MIICASCHCELEYVRETADTSGTVWYDGSLAVDSYDNIVIEDRDCQESETDSENTLCYECPACGYECRYLDDLCEIVDPDYEPDNDYTSDNNDEDNVSAEDRDLLRVLRVLGLVDM